MNMFKEQKIKDEEFTYYMLPDDSVISEEEWNVMDSEPEDYWQYTFAGEELGLLKDVMNTKNAEVVQMVLHTLVLGSRNSSSYKFHHALFCLLMTRVEVFSTEELH